IVYKARLHVLFIGTFLSSWVQRVRIQGHIQCFSSGCRDGSSGNRSVILAIVVLSTTQLVRCIVGRSGLVDDKEVRMLSDVVRLVVQREANDSLVVIAHDLFPYHHVPGQLLDTLRRGGLSDRQIVIMSLPDVTEAQESLE